jgi:hypothetical protein
MRYRLYRLRRHGDLAIGILAGIVLGLVVVALFVFVFSEQAVDAPSIGGSTTTTTPAPPVTTGSP